MRKACLKWTMLGALALIAAGCATYPDPATTRQIAEKMVSEDFTAPRRPCSSASVQDRSQQICSKIGGRQAHAGGSGRSRQAGARLDPVPGIRQARRRLEGRRQARARRRRRPHPAAARLEKRKENGGLCQNCHALAPGEINVGNVGPSLTGYGAQRGNSEADREAHLREDLQRVGLLPVLQHAAPGRHRPSDAGADHPRGRVSDRPAVPVSTRNDPARRP